VVSEDDRYAEQLLDDMKQLVRWPERVLTMQQNWIGKSIGTFVDFTINDLGSRCGSSPPRGHDFRLQRRFPCA